jgi:hypothetical protein
MASILGTDGEKIEIFVIATGQTVAAETNQIFGSEAPGTPKFGP